MPASIQSEASAELLGEAARRTLRALEGSDGWQVLHQAENAYHYGDDPIRADVEAQSAFETGAREHPYFDDLRISAIVGEEHIAQVAPLGPGERVIVVDPLDGSKPWLFARMGYCVAALTLLADENGRLTVDSAIVATPTHAFTLVGNDQLRFGRTFATLDEQGPLLSVAPEPPTQAPSLACVAWKAKERNRAMHMVNRLEGWTFLSFGGNPVTPWVVAGGLTASITIKPTTTWDAIGVLMACATDATVGDLDGTLVSGPTFRDLFTAVLLEGNVAVIPPMIVAKNDARYQQVLLAAAALPPLDGPDIE